MRTSLTLTTLLALASTSAVLHAQPGALDPTFNPGMGVDGAAIYDIVLQPDGKVLIAGWFDEYNGVVQRNVARINSNGTLDASFVLGLLSNSVDLIALQADGKILCAGPFGNGITRLNSDGSVDPSFVCGWDIYNTIDAIAAQPDGKILIGGIFTLYNGTARNGIARLNGDGSLDTSFDPGDGLTGTTLPTVGRFALQPDGKILIGGRFAAYDGTARSRIARLNSDGSLDTSFDPGTGSDDWVGDIAVRPDGRIMIAGSFDTYNGIARNRIARINSDGSLDASFDPGEGPNDAIYTMALQPDGRAVVGGLFTEWAGNDQNMIARINADGSWDPTFDSGTGLYDQFSKLYSLALQPDGRIVIAGFFEGYNGTPRNKIARVMGGGSIGIGEAAPLAGLRVAPNPVINSLYLAGLEEGAHHWSITEAQGRLLLQGTLGNSATPIIDVSSLAQGSYLLIVHAGRTARTLPFVKP